MSGESNTAARTPGRLAEVIATRGGQAPPEAPFVIEHREALIYILCQAAELEHGIMAQYLFAAFSLKQSEAEGLTDAEAAAVQRWRKQIMHIAAQEMLHLALVQNLLAAVGAAPHLTRPNFPQPASHYPAGVHLLLLPFGDQALRHFMFLERPEGMALHDAEGLAAVNRAAPLVQAGDIVPRGQDFATVGHLYRSIEAGIAHLADKYGEDRLFVGPPRAQATAKHFGWPELVAVTDAASAQRAIDEILEQGEGLRGAWQNAHFGQFVAILDEFEQLREANRAFGPARPVIAANVRPSERDPDCLLVTDPTAKRVMDLFNVCYEILLLALQRFFAHTEETDAQLAVLADAAVTLMIAAVKPLGDLITTLPAGPEYPGRTVGPSFELFYESDYLLPHRDAAWVLLAERIEEAAAFCESAGPELTGLAPVRAALHDIARSLTAALGPGAGGLPAGPDVLVRRVDGAPVAGIVALADATAQVLLVQRAERVPVELDTEAGSVRYPDRAAGEGQRRARDDVLVPPREVGVAGVAQVRGGGGQVRHRGQADAQVGVGVHGHPEAEGLADPGQQLGPAQPAPVVVVGQHHLDGAGRDGRRQLGEGDHAHVGGQRHRRVRGDLGHPGDALGRVLQVLEHAV